MPGNGRTMNARRILVVDDSADGALALAALLRGMGHESHVAHDGREALEAALRVRPDVVFLDIAMPGMSGHDVARRLRQEFGSTLRIVALTGFGQDTDRAQSQEAGFDHHLVKPADPNYLKSLLG